MNHSILTRVTKGFLIVLKIYSVQKTNYRFSVLSILERIILFHATNCDL